MAPFTHYNHVSFKSSLSALPCEINTRFLPIIVAYLSDLVYNIIETYFSTASVFCHICKMAYSSEGRAKKPLSDEFKISMAVLIYIYGV